MHEYVNARLLGLYRRDYEQKVSIDGRGLRIVWDTGSLRNYSNFGTLPNMVIKTRVRSTPHVTHLHPDIQ